MPPARETTTVPTNLTDHTRVLLRLPGDAAPRNVPVDGALAALPVEEAALARRFYAWSGKRNYEGSYWFATTGTHVAHESLIEADWPGW